MGAERAEAEAEQQGLFQKLDCEGGRSTAGETQVKEEVLRRGELRMESVVGWGKEPAGVQKCRRRGAALDLFLWPRELKEAPLKGVPLF